MASNTKFRINGLVDTSKNVLENINTLANESGCYVTWDPTAGKWTVIINDAFPSVKEFDDSNILGEINVSGTGINELYNKVSVSYPHKDMRDTVDVVDVEIDSSERFTNEDDNTLELSLPHVNNTVQAQYIAGRELKQSRLDLIIEFRANYQANELKAGDIIEVTNTTLDFTQKEFRIIQIDEEDTSDGNLIYSITAQEYDGTIYNASGINYEYRSNFNGIKSKVFNAEIEQSDEADLGGTMAKLLGANALLGVVNGLFKNFFTSDDETGVLTQTIEFNDPDTQKLMEAGAKKPSLTHAPAGSAAHNNEETPPSPVWLCNNQTETLSVSHDCEVCFLTTPDYEYDYTITGLTTFEINIELEGTIEMSGNSGSLTFTPTVTTEKTFTVTIGDNSTQYIVSPTPDEYIQNVTATSTTITEGQSTTVNVTTIGKTNGDTLSYAISGSTGSVSTALTGSVTVNSNAASLTINTTDDSAFGGTETINVTFTPQANDNYCTIMNNEVEIDIQNNATTGPAPAPDTTCEYVKVPVVWCATYHGADGQAKSLSPKAWAMLPVAQASEPTVALPTAVSVTKGSPSTVSVTTTQNIALSGAMGGVPYQVLTAFSGIAPNGIITGTNLRTVYGYPFTDVGETSIGDMSNISSSTPSDGQVLVWNNTTQQWEPTTL